MNNTVFQTIQLSNNGDTPIKFQFLDRQDTLFVCKPTRGVLQPNQHQLILFKFSPKEARVYRSAFKCVLNNSLANALDLTVTGIAEFPDLQIDNGANLYFKSTCVGSSSNRSFRIHNPTGIAVSFSVKLITF